MPGLTRLSLACLAALSLLGAAACGSSGGGQPAGSTKVTMSDFKFDPATLSGHAGKLTFYLVNSGGVSHDMTVAGPGGAQYKSELVQPGSTATFTIDNLAAGTYKVVCSQPGHEQSGMTASLQVT